MHVGLVFYVSQYAVMLSGGSTCYVSTGSPLSKLSIATRVSGNCHVEKLHIISSTLGLAMFLLKQATTSTQLECVLEVLCGMGFNIRISEPGVDKMNQECFIWDVVDPPGMQLRCP